MERDIYQKMGLVKLFWFWGYAPDIDVKLFHPGGTGRAKVELTDIDVLGFKISPELEVQRVAGDCKTRKRTSAINRAFWLKGVMGHLQVKRGFVVVSREVELDHKTAAQQLGVTLLSDEDFKVLVGSVLPSDFPHEMNMFNPDTWLKYFADGHAQSALGPLWRYRRERYWQDSAQNGLRYTLMELRRHATAFQRNRIHAAIFVDAVTAFAMSLCQMLCELFTVYLVTDNKKELDHQMKAYVYGGRDRYDYLNNLTRQVLQLRSQLLGSGGPQEGFAREGLALPGWDQFMQLFRTALDAPSHFFAVPQVMRYVLFEHILQAGSPIKVSRAIPNISSHAVKLGSDLLKYISLATQVPEYVWRPVRDILDGLIVDLPSAVICNVCKLDSNPPAE